MYTNIKSDIKEAMKSKNTIKRDVLKMVVDKAKTVMKERNPTDFTDNIPNDVVIQAINKEIKQLNQTKEALIGKEDTQYYHENAQKIAILSEYLPKQMTNEEIDNAVFNILSGGNYSDFGSKMRAVMSELKGKADNKLIKEIVEKYK